MLSREDNEKLTRIGPGTQMGALMRRYWTPALLSSEIAEPDGAPVRIGLLGRRPLTCLDRWYFSSGATSNAGCAASITAGSTM